MSSPQRVDILVVGAGFAGLCLLHRLRGMGYSVRVLEAASGVGGVWHWNRYPGARCDVESLQYSYSFSSELEQEWEWTERYASQPEILRYIEHVADRFDLRRDIQLNTRVTAMEFDEVSARWEVQAATADKAGTSHFSAQFCIMATGALSNARLPAIPGIEGFAGQVCHTGAWPHAGVDLAGKRVGVIGTGSSGIQAITAIAKQAKHLTVFQRTPNFSIPAWNSPLTPEAQAAWKAIYREYRARAREIGSLYEFSDKAATEVSEEERVREFQRRWDKGGVNFVHAFNDLMVNQASNDSIANFVRARIRATVRDAQVAEALCPTDHPLGAKRICVDTGYYETYNRPNVTLVNLRQTPIVEVTASGVRTAEASHELDTLVCATGYDALTGAVLAIDIRGRDGITLQAKWANGPRTYLGLMTHGFPNFFMITGAGSPSVLVNMIVGIEHHTEWISACLAHLRKQGHNTVEADKAFEDNWVEHVNAAAAKTLLPKANSWFLGANIPGKPRVFMPYVARIGVYRRECQQVADAGYAGFVLSRSAAARYAPACA